MCALGHILRKSFVQPTRHAVGVEPVEDEMHNFVPQGISRKFVGWIALNEKASCRMNFHLSKVRVCRRLEIGAIRSGFRKYRCEIWCRRQAVRVPTLWPQPGNETPLLQKSVLQH